MNSIPPRSNVPAAANDVDIAYNRAVNNYGPAQNANRKNIELFDRGCDIMVGAVLAVVTGRWIVDGACDPGPASDRIQTALMVRDYTAIKQLTDVLAEAIYRAHRAGDYIAHDNRDEQLIAQAEAIVEAHYNEILDIRDIAA